LAEDEVKTLLVKGGGELEFFLFLNLTNGENPFPL